MKPKVSIITISYNSEDTIEQTIQSVLSQTYDNVEYVVIDAGSTDRTVEIVNRYKDKIAYFISEPDKGISDGFNKGITAATGDIIGICNSNDILLSDAVQKIVDAYEENVEVYRASELVRNFDTGYEYILHPTMTFKKVPTLFHVCHMGCYIKKKAFDKYGLYDVAFKNSMDLELLFRFHRKGAVMKEVDAVVGIFRLGGVSQAGEKVKRNECREIIRRNGGSVFDEYFFLTYLWAKGKVKKVLNLLGKDIASKVRFGVKK